MQPEQPQQPEWQSDQPVDPKPSAASKPKLLIILAIAVLLAVGIGLVFVANPKSTTDKQTTNTNQQAVEIEITADGFNPNIESISKGTKVTWINKDSKPHKVASNPHPEHTGTPGLDSKDPVGPEGNYSFTFDKVGTVTYHDHLNPTTNGTIVVSD